MKNTGKLLEKYWKNTGNILKKNPGFLTLGGQPWGPLEAEGRPFGKTMEKSLKIIGFFILRTVCSDAGEKIQDFRTVCSDLGEKINDFRTTTTTTTTTTSLALRGSPSLYVSAHASLLGFELLEKALSVQKKRVFGIIMLNT